MDQRALSTPPSEEASIEALARWLQVPALSQRHRARAAFRWVTSRIRYDVDAYRSVCNGRPDDIPPQDVETVLRRRTAVCAGYARVYEALGRAMGLEVELVRGHCRTSRSVPWQPYGMQDAHAWNAVRLDGQWFLLDSTWGSGHLDATSERFTPAFQPFYFLTPPEQLISSHLPLEARWQLLARPVTEAEQKATPMVSSAGFEHGLVLPEGTSVRLQAGGPAQLRFTTRPGTLLGATLHAASTGRGAKLEAAVFVDREGDSWAVQFACPARGPFVLEIFVGDSGGSSRGDTMLRWATAFFIESTSSAGGTAGFPRQFGSYSEVGARLVAPRQAPLQSRRAQRFEIIVPGALEMYMFNGSQQVRMTRDGDRFWCEAAPLPVPLSLGARFAGTGRKFMTLVQYQVR